MKSVFVLTYRWIDIPNQSVRELFDSAEKAEAERDRLKADELGRKDFDPSSIGKLEIIVERYDYSKTVSKICV